MTDRSIDCANKDTVYSSLLDGQIRYARKENRYLEFKSNYQDADRLGRYISALSNGACLDRQDFGYLYFGIDDGTLEIKGTSFDASKAKAKGSQALELYLRRMISPKINFSITDFCYHGTQSTIPGLTGRQNVSKELMSMIWTKMLSEWHGKATGSVFRTTRKPYRNGVTRCFWTKRD